MPKSLFFQNKKSSIELSLIHLLEVMLAIVIVFALLHLIFRFSSIFIGRQEHDSALNNLEALAIRVEELVKDKKQSDAQTMVYSIPNDYILVGFGYNDKSIMKTECTNEEIVKSRSNRCRSKSCLCVYNNYGFLNKGGKDFDARSETGATPLRCKPFNEKITFLGEHSSLNVQGSITQWKIPNSPSDYKYLVLYGDCVRGEGKSLWGARKISIQKYRDGENIFILLKDASIYANEAPLVWTQLSTGVSP